MASRVLYSPIIDSYVAAFVAGASSYCRVYFSLSKFNTSSDFKCAHVSVTKQDSGISVVKKQNSNGRYRTTGIILNAKVNKSETNSNLYYVDIMNEDLGSIDGEYSGWIPGWIYKIQLRLAAAEYDESIGQAAWLSENANNFSEWSTICVTKAIGEPIIDIPILDYNSSSTEINAGEKTVYLSTLNFSGTYKCPDDITETLYSYKVSLENEDGDIVEDSGTLYSSSAIDGTQSFNYLFKTQREEKNRYIVKFTYETINKYSKTISMSFYQRETTRTDFELRVLTCENDSNGIMNSLSSIYAEEEAGRIGIKLYNPKGNSSSFKGNLCLRRTDNLSNFQIWEDLKIFVLTGESVNSLPIYYDYTAESGVFYQYGIQYIDRIGERGGFNTTETKIIRNYNYSYLFDSSQRQLTLMFNNNISNIKPTVLDSKTDSLGGVYSNINRNGKTCYKTFPISGLISFEMDDEYHMFANQETVFSLNKEHYDDYNEYNDRFFYEKRFRDEVYKFLIDGKEKLFKSTTEGNIVVRLMDVQFTPESKSNRMYYNFSANAIEAAPATLESYLNLKFFEVGDYATSFSSNELRLGQLSTNLAVGTNLIEEIYNKYDSKNKSIAGFKKILEEIKYLRITFNDKPLRVKNNANQIISGYNFKYNGTTITSKNNIYIFDDNFSFIPGIDSITMLGDEEGIVNNVNITVDFYYSYSTDIYVEKEIKSKTSFYNMGQLHDKYSPNTSLYDKVYRKHYTDFNGVERSVDAITSVTLEADPGCVFDIKDAYDDTVERHIINSTGILNLFEITNIKDIQYIGKLDRSTKEILGVDTDILLDYRYVLVKTIYEEAN